VLTHEVLAARPGVSILLGIQTKSDTELIFAVMSGRNILYLQ